MARSFRIHKKDGTKVAEGESPLSITGVPPNTSVASGDYYAIAVENGYDSEPVNIPSFTTLPILATSVTLNKTTLTLDGGSSETLTATVLPADTTNKTVTWESSNTAVATVSTSGVVSAVKGATTGTANITATTTNGMVATCTLTVNQYEVTVDGVAATAAYAPKDISQADYLALATKDANTLYRVQPTDSGSGRVHLLGSKIVDVTKKGDNRIYNRNLMPNTSSSLTRLTASNTYDLFYFRGGNILPVKKNKTYTTAITVDNTIEQPVTAILRVYTYPLPTDTPAYERNSDGSYYEIRQGDVHTSIVSYAPTDDGYLGALGSKISPRDLTMQFSAYHKNLSVYAGDKTEYVEYTVAPEDILTVTDNLGGGTFG